MSVERTLYSLQSVSLSHHKNLVNTKDGEVERGDICCVIPNVGQYTVSFSSSIRTLSILIRISIRRTRHFGEGGHNLKIIHLMDESFQCDPNEPACTFNVSVGGSNMYIDCQFFKLTFSFMSVRSGHTFTEDPVIPQRPVQDMVNNDVIEDLVKKGILTRPIQGRFMLC